MKYIFVADTLDDNLRQLLSKVLLKIERLSMENILGLGEVHYTDLLWKSHILHLPELLLGSGELEGNIQKVRDKKQSLIQGTRIKKAIDYKDELTIYIRFRGKISSLNQYPLLYYKPFYSCKAITAELLENALEVKIQFEHKAEVARAKDNFIRTFLQNYAQLESRIKEFNKRLQKEIKNKFLEKKREYLEKQNILEELGIKFQLRPTKNIELNPDLRKPIRMEMPKMKEHFQPEPYISTESYHQILTLITDTCKNMERLPSIFKGKSEPDLRDFLLFVLDPNFEFGSATGETFNVGGKADIIIRHTWKNSSSIVFIAECKFWSGPSDYLKAIDQLLGYLTWRDTKTALIIFTKKTKLTSVFSAIKKHTRAHENYTSLESDDGNSFFQFKFHLGRDKNREIWMAVMIFDMSVSSLSDKKEKI